METLQGKWQSTDSALSQLGLGSHGTGILEVAGCLLVKAGSLLVTLTIDIHDDVTAIGKTLQENVLRLLMFGLQFWRIVKFVTFVKTV